MLSSGWMAGARAVQGLYGQGEAEPAVARPPGGPRMNPGKACPRGRADLQSLSCYTEIVDTLVAKLKRAGMAPDIDADTHVENSTPS